MKYLQHRNSADSHHLGCLGPAILPLPSMPVRVSLCRSVSPPSGALPHCQRSNSDQFRPIPSNSDQKKVKTTENFSSRQNKTEPWRGIQEITDVQTPTRNHE